MDLRLVGQHVSVREAGQGFSFGSLRLTYDRTLAQLLRWKTKAPLRSPQGRVHFFYPFSLVESRTGARGRRVKPARFVGALPSSRSETKRLDAPPALRKIVAENGMDLSMYGCPWLPFFADASPCSVPVFTRGRQFTFADAIRSISLVCNR